MGREMELLSAMDKARTQLYHFKTIVIAGLGFFTDAYDLFCISTVSRLLGRLYYYDPMSGKPGTLPPNVSAMVNGSALIGTLLGQLFFGWLGDKWGRKRVYGITLLLMIGCSIGSGLSLGNTAKSVMSTMCFFRFWLGFGIGGDYPLSATIMSEYANKKTRGAFIAAVFAMQGIGILAATTTSIIVSSAFNKAYPHPSFDQSPLASTPPQADFVWRIVLLFGSVPAAFTYYWRMKMPETPRYTVLVIGNAKQAAKDMKQVLLLDLPLDEEKAEANHSNYSTYGLFSMQFVKRHGLQLLGTTSTWFLLDVAFYSQNLFQKDVFTTIGWIPPARTMSGLEEMFRISRAQAIVALCSTIPGYWFTVFTIEYLGRKFIQLMGFFMMTAFMFGLSIPYDSLRGKECLAVSLCGGQRVTFVVLFGFTFFFANFGPNSTTFIIPAELFPARLRSTCHGISAAAGKAGAIVGAFGFLHAAQDSREGHQEAGYGTGIGTRKALILLACTNFLGFFFTFLCPETKGRSLEDISGENDEIYFAEYPYPDAPSITRSQNRAMAIAPHHQYYYYDG